MNNSVKLCRNCGKPISIIGTRTYRNIVVNASPVEVHADPYGDMYIRADGSKIRAIPADLYNDPSVTAEIVWQQHVCKGGAR